MIRGLYTAASGMITGLLRHESIIHNMANVRTVGYKADRTTVTDFPSMLLTQVYRDRPGAELGRAGTGVSISDIVTNFEDGPLKLTDNPLDLAVTGEGFFRVQTPDGVRYTRDGRFHRDSDGSLITSNGYYVLGQNGPITLPLGLVTISPQGQVFVDETLVDEISLARFENMDDVTKEDQTLFSTAGDEPELMAAAEKTIYQGYIEDSNVDSGQSMAEMMSVLRLYQASQRLVQFQDKINERTVNDLGRI